MAIENMTRKVLEGLKAVIAAEAEHSSGKAASTEDAFNLAVSETMLTRVQLSNTDRANMLAAINVGLEAAGFAHANPEAWEDLGVVTSTHAYTESGRPGERMIQLSTTYLSNIAASWDKITDVALQKARESDRQRGDTPHGGV